MYCSKHIHSLIWCTFMSIISISWNKGRLGSMILRGNDSTRLKFEWAKLPPLKSVSFQGCFQSNFNLVKSFPLNIISILTINWAIASNVLFEAYSSTNKMYPYEHNFYLWLFLENDLQIPCPQKEPIISFF